MEPAVSREGSGVGASFIRLDIRVSAKAAGVDRISFKDDAAKNRNVGSG